MTIERALRLIAGLFVAVSAVLGLTLEPRFLWFTVFVGLNLVQSSFTDWCPMITLLSWAGLKREGQAHQVVGR